MYDETPPKQLSTLEEMEEALRAHTLEHVSPEMGHLLQQQAGQVLGEVGNSKAFFGLTTHLAVQPH